MKTTRRRVPAAPRLAAMLQPSTPKAGAITDGTAMTGLLIEAVDLSGQPPAEQVEVAGCRFDRAGLHGLRWSHTTITDTAFTGCDLSNLVLADSSLLRAEITGSRAIGMTAGASVLRDVTFTDCRAPLASFRFSKLFGVRFTACVLSGADFTGCRFENVAFDDCDLAGAQFSGVTVASARFAGCDLAGIGGVTSLSGARVAERDLPGLAVALASAAGIEVDRSA